MPPRIKFINPVSPRSSLAVFGANPKVINARWVCRQVEVLPDRLAGVYGFLGQKGGLSKDDIGTIEMLDFMSFVAVKKTEIKGLLQQIAQEKMKGKKYKITEAW